ncbi:MAG: carboxymuconolactone decarboxylase family protein [bacterium]|nr:carboxymuconolactone decarboxylase family protein [bacterium]
MARLPYVDPETAPPAVREVFDRLPIHLNVFRMMAHAETSFRPMLQLGTSILGKQQLSPILRELVILRVGRLSGAEYEWTQHVPIAKAVGANDAQVAALERDDLADPAFDAVERAVLAFTTEVVRDVRASDATLAAVRAHFSDREVVELLLTIGYYMMIARLLESTGVDLDAPAGARLVSSSR